MSQPVLLQDDFSLGANQDVPRHQLPKGKVYSVTDAIPELNGVPLEKRGGWHRPWAALASANYVAGVQIAPFAAGTKLVAWDDDGDLHYTSSFSATAWTTLSNSVVPAHAPTFWKNVVIVFDVNGSSGGYSFDGSGGTSLGVSAPTASMSTVYKNHLVAARSSANTNRVWFSSAADYTAWDTAADGQWLDADMPIQGITALRNMVLLFGEGKSQRIRGDIIPGVVGSDMVVEPLFTIGCSDPASIATTDDYVIFANSSGIYYTDGTGVIDLMEQVGMSQFWKTQMEAYASTWTISAALHRGWYVFSVMDGSTFKLAGMLDVRRRRYVSLTNVKATMMVSSPPGVLDLQPKLVWSERASLYVANGTSMWSPSSTYKNDGDGTAVTWSAEFPHYFGKPGKKRWKSLYVKRKTVDAGSDNPALTFSYTTDLGSASYTSLSPTFPENSAVTRDRIPLGFAAEGVSIKVVQSNASATTSLYALEADMWALEPGRL